MSGQQCNKIERSRRRGLRSKQANYSRTCSRLPPSREPGVVQVFVLTTRYLVCNHHGGFPNSANLSVLFARLCATYLSNNKRNATISFEWYHAHGTLPQLKCGQVCNFGISPVPRGIQSLYKRGVCLCCDSVRLSLIP
jgi:hypothetical protein